MKTHASCRLGFVVVLVLFLLGSMAWGTDFKPIVPAEGYQHDRFVTLPRDIMKEFRAYITSFDGPDDDDGDGRSDLLGEPQWVAYELRRSDTDPGPAPSRPSTWITDPDLYRQGIAPKDDSYRGSGYSRGHLCMKEHAWRLGANADWNTHTVLNACPQLQTMNAGVWLHLENQCASWADEYGKVWIIAGPIFYGRHPTEWIGDAGEKRVAVPDAFFKIIVKDSGDPEKPDVLAFLIPQYGVGAFASSSESKLESYLTSVDVIEVLTGLDFLTTLEDGKEAKVERVVQESLWPISSR